MATTLTTARYSKPVRTYFIVGSHGNYYCNTSVRRIGGPYVRMDQARSAILEDARKDNVIPSISIGDPNHPEPIPKGRIKS